MTQITPELLQPPGDVPEIQRGNWFMLPEEDPVTDFISRNYWDRPAGPGPWEVARLSNAAYVYREKTSGWSIVAKYYSVKTGQEAEHYSQREYTITESAFNLDLGITGLRAVKPSGAWRGILFLEYVDGLTLEDMIAVRRSRPGTLMPALESAGQLLAVLHSHDRSDFGRTDFPVQMKKARKILADLAKYGVIQEEPLIVNAIESLLDRWEANPRMTDYMPAVTHGDTTTSNFIYPWGGGTVALDWERARMADPAFDLGRLIAEISHSIKQHGGSHAEAQTFVNYLVQVYVNSLPPDWSVEALVERATFYRAVSTLRIARNGWVSRLNRTVLVAQGLALLGSP
jgi:tRNA A-37 threonylcarbamoyl transferase component Bud32